MIPLITHQEPGIYTTYRLDEYTKDIEKRHRLVHKGFSIQTATDLLDQILNNKS